MTPENQISGATEDNSSPYELAPDPNNQSVDVLNLQPRNRQLLARYQIITIADLISDFDKLPDLAGFGETLIAEIREAFNQIHLETPIHETVRTPIRKTKEKHILDTQSLKIAIDHSWVSRIPPTIQIDNISIDKLFKCSCL